MSWVFIFKKKQEKPKHLELTYLLYYLYKMKQKNKKICNGITQKKSDQIMVEEKFVNDIIF